MSDSPIVAVLGAGSWGTALAHLVAVKGAQTRLWARDAAAVQRLTSTHENDKYLPGARLENVRFYADLEEVLQDADVDYLCRAVRGRARIGCANRRFD